MNRDIDNKIRYPSVVKCEMCYTIYNIILLTCTMKSIHIQSSLTSRCGGSVVSTRMLWSSHYLHDYSDFYSDFGINSLHTFVWITIIDLDLP